MKVYVCMVTKRRRNLGHFSCRERGFSSVSCRLWSFHSNKDPYITYIRDGVSVHDVALCVRRKEKNVLVVNGIRNECCGYISKPHKYNSYITLTSLRDTWIFLPFILSSCVSLLFSWTHISPAILAPLILLTLFPSFPSRVRANGISKGGKVRLLVTCNVTMVSQVI